ncbi:MAG: 30S ribosomal protein S28e [DPANN group archaeon]|nr:30S ribosomal protein S28e [DPANN group archaeon]
MAQKQQKPKQQQQGNVKQQLVEVGEHAFPSQVMEIVGSMGTREGGKQVRVKVLTGRDVGKIIRRNVVGPIRIGDILMLRETEIEASPLKGRKR